MQAFLLHRAHTRGHTSEEDGEKEIAKERDRERGREREVVVPLLRVQSGPGVSRSVTSGFPNRGPT